MKRRLRLFLVALICCVPLFLMVPGWRTAAFQLGEPYTGQAFIEGPIRLDVTLSPPIAIPGQRLTLQLRLTNLSGEAAAPLVSLDLPQGVSLETGMTPAGTTMNLQTGQLSWSPVSTFDGGQREIEMSLRVESADILSPAKEIVAYVALGQDEFSVAAPIWIGIAPQISEIFGPSQVAVGQPVQLRADVRGSGPISHSWDLGDGRRVDVDEPVVLYPAPGIYEVKLQVANPLTAVQHSKTITVVPHPAAQFSADDFTPGVGQEVNFLSLSGGQPPLAYTWDFGDGTGSDQASPAHVYAAPGSYQVHVTVSNQYGASDAYWPVSVGLPPVADLEIPDQVVSGERLEGLAFGDESVTVFTWNMGDGTEMEGEQVSHVYKRDGDFYASLRATNEFGDSELGRWIRVLPGAPILYLPVILHADGSAIVDSAEVSDDPFVLELEPVDLEEPFVMAPLELPAGISPSQQLYLYINEARRQFDLPPLTQIGELTAAAQHHTDDMARFAYTAHSGSDGSFPAERFLWFNYRGGYAGEATAWGFQHPYQAVEFWINSPAHRRIILNQYASQVGVGFTLDYNAPNVWYWTAEFGAIGVAPTQPILRLAQPAAVDLDAARTGSLPAITDELPYRWNWPMRLQGGQRFVLTLLVAGEAHPVAILDQPLLGTSYGADVAAFPMALDYQSENVSLEWQVRLESAGRQLLSQSERRPLLLAPDLTLPSPTPLSSPTPSPTATPAPTETPVVDPVAPPPTPRPPVPTPPLLITATPTS
jgi:PKD repeat protein